MGWVMSIGSRLHALGLLCCLVGLTWAKAARAQDSPAGQPGAAQAKKEESDSASPPVASAHVATVPDAAVPAFGFRVTGRTFSIEGNLGARSVMGTTLLPWAGREPPLIRGRAAYVVLPGNGLAVIDIGLARFPYVVWRLSPDLAVRSIAIEDQTLRVTTGQGTIQYDIRDPLQPRGPDTFAADPRRYYDASAAESGTADHTWEEQGAGWPQRGRRVYLRDGSTALGSFHALDLARDELTLEVMGQKRTLSTRHILHVEPVFFGEVGTGTRSLAAGPGSRGAAKAAALLLGVPMVILYSAVVVTTIVVAVAIVICGPPVPYVSSRCQRRPLRSPLGGARPAPNRCAALRPSVGKTGSFCSRFRQRLLCDGGRWVLERAPQIVQAHRSIRRSMHVEVPAA